MIGYPYDDTITTTEDTDLYQKYKYSIILGKTIIIMGSTKLITMG